MAMRGIDIRQLTHGVVDAVAPAIVRVMIGGVHAPAGKHVRAAHERRALVAADHEHFGTVRRIAKHDHGCRGTRIHRKRTARHGFILVCKARSGRSRRATYSQNVRAVSSR